MFGFFVYFFLTNFQLVASTQTTIVSQHKIILELLFLHILENVFTPISNRSSRYVCGTVYSELNEKRFGMKTVNVHRSPFSAEIRIRKNVRYWMQTFFYRLSTTPQQTSTCVARRSWNTEDPRFSFPMSLSITPTAYKPLFCRPKHSRQGTFTKGTMSLRHKRQSLRQ